MKGYLMNGTAGHRGRRRLSRRGAGVLAAAASGVAVLAAGCVSAM
jgi:hypothetical protein